VKLEIDLCWELVLEAGRLNRFARLPLDDISLGIGEDNAPLLTPLTSSKTILLRDSSGQWRRSQAMDTAQDALFDLYLPFCRPAAHRPVIIAHLGQSLDGRIATETGHSYYVTGPENITHLHRMRALADAIVVGAGTVRADDPSLTTRRVPGTNPVRVIIDAARRLSDRYKVFQDGAAETLLLCDPTRAPETHARHGQAAVVGVQSHQGHLRPAAIVGSLRERGLNRIFIEGGGITVSRFLQDRMLDGLQIAIAPLIIGSGRPGITLPVIGELNRALRPRCRVVTMGADVLFDCRFEG
jgi:riboflavin-specific deaminase-like protein